MSCYRQADVAFERGEGAYIYDVNAKRYLDFNAGIAVSSFGHAHPHLVKALQDQAAKLWHTSNLYRIPHQDRLAERLVANSFADKCFFVNSGVEAIECAIKTARKYFYDQGQPDKNRIITLEGSFHGRSMAAISAAGQEKLVTGFGPLLPGFDRVRPDDLEAMAHAIGPETAAILVEPVLGEGGVLPLSDGYLQGLRALCDQHDLLLICDEIQCGMGRTGKLFAFEWAGITPDIVAAAKGIGGGFPFGACLATEKAASGMTPGSHGTTYGGNPLAMAVGNAVLDLLLAPGFLDHVNEIGTYLKEQLDHFAAQNHNSVELVRGRGLMLGLKLRGLDPRETVATALANGLLVAPAGDNVIRLLPPLIIEKAQVDEAIGLLETTLSAMIGDRAQKAG
ncbi:acetylornithine aminotransferase [Iodidimonas nitroreducens]|uniref:Acetylornithine aminotransferase n=2 Tax=Iodidimonas nitroreducens TaxID=1236968 RepID=A0A5A7N360_9PROT|nr:acetylornithine aminotransferase [Iodidimonas nitroreducens]